MARKVARLQSRILVHSRCILCIRRRDMSPVREVGICGYPTTLVQRGGTWEFISFDFSLVLDIHNTPPGN